MRLPRVTIESFEEGTELVRVYLAASLAEAQAVEGALDATGVTYAVEVEELASRTVLGLFGARRAAGFWVATPDLDPCVRALETAGHVSGLVRT